MTKKTPLQPNAPGANPSPRRRDAPEPRGRLQIEERDRAILLDLFWYGAMLRGQIQALYFGSVPRCNARLRQLFDAELVDRAFLPLSPYPAVAYGSQAVYALGRAGVPIIASILGWDAARVRERQRHGTPTYLTHALEIVNVRLALEAAMANQSAVRVLRFVPELLCRHSYDMREPGGFWRQEIFKPDAIFLLERDTRRAAFALEVDLGHTGRREFETKLRIHGRYRSSGLFAKRYGLTEFVTLCITTSAVRREHLLALAKEQPHPLWLTTFDELRERGALATIWRAPDADIPMSLSQF